LVQSLFFIIKIDKEKEVSWRRISKRNEERRLVLLEQQKQEEAAKADGAENSKEL